MRSGAGLVTLGLAEDLAAAVIRKKSPEIMLLPLPQTKGAGMSLAAYKKIKDFACGVDVLAVGPGMGQDKSTRGLIEKVVGRIDKPMVIDADGLNALAGHTDSLLLRKGRITVVTPHPGEMAGLTGLSVKKIQADREKAAAGFARKYKITVVLKGHHTLVAGAGKLYVNKSGNPGMATAGSGDVLSGIIAAFLGQGLNGFSAAKYAVYLHGLAGDIAAKKKSQMGMVASDIIAEIPAAIKRCG